MADSGQIVDIETDETENVWSEGEDDAFESFTEIDKGFDRREENKEGGWSRQPRKKRKKKSNDSNDSIDPERFTDLSTDEKLDCIYKQIHKNFDKIRLIEVQQIKTGNEIQKVNKDLENVTTKVMSLENDSVMKDEQIKMLMYHSIDIEARSRRNNLIFYNITEKMNKSDREVILEFIDYELDVDNREIVIERAHRLGRVKNHERSKDADPKRPIIVKFRDYVDTETIMSKAFMLKNSRFGVDRDYPREIAEARKELYTCEEARKARYHRQKVQIRYPARLFIEDKPSQKSQRVHRENPESEGVSQADQSAHRNQSTINNDQGQGQSNK